MLRECISAEEYDMMNYWRKMYAYQNECEGMPVSIFDLLHVWEEAKEPLFHLLGNQLILSKNINYTKDPQEIKKDLSYILFQNRSFGVKFRAFASNYAYPLNNYLHKLLDTDILQSNQWSGAPFEIPFPNGKQYKVQGGTKVLKVLGKIASAYNIEGFEEFRLQHSLALNDKNLSGTLSLSIHPLDFWTMSDNNSRWQSCMNWSEYGCYRAGTVEMMNSPVVIMAYLQGSDPLCIHGKTWNDKRWRQLFIVNKDMVFAVKGYPYQNEELTEEVLNWIAVLAKENLGWTYIPDVYQYNYKSNILMLNGKDCSCIKPIIFNTAYMYNDMGTLSQHSCLLNSIETFKSSSYILDYSGASQCVCCGELSPELSNETCLACQDCDPVKYCEDCGASLTSENCYYIGDSVYCEDCFIKIGSTCSRCGDNYYNEDGNLVNIILSTDEDDFVICYDTPLFLCPSCFNQLYMKVPLYEGDGEYCVFYHDLAETFLPSELKGVQNVEEWIKSNYYCTQKMKFDNFEKI